MNQSNLDKILADHKKWLNGEGGKKADLSNANLRNANLSNADLRYTDLRNANLHGADLRYTDLHGADLREADLGGANLDYSCWPLWCGSLKAKVDARIAAQLVYHTVRACQSVTDDEGVKAFCNSPEVIALANRFHHTDECGRIEAKEAE